MGLNIRLFSVVLAAVFGLWLGGCASSEVETAPTDSAAAPQGGSRRYRGPGTGSG